MAARSKKRQRSYSTLWFTGGVLFVLFIGFAASVGAVRELGPAAHAAVAPACPDGEPAADCRTTVTGIVDDAHLEETPLRTRPGYEPEDHWVYRVKVDPDAVPATTKFWLDRPNLGLIEVTPRRTEKLLDAGEQVTLELLRDDVVQVTNESGVRFYGGEAKEPVGGWVTVPLAGAALAVLYGAVLFAIGHLYERRRGSTDAPAEGAGDRRGGLLSVGVLFAVIPVVFGASVVAAVVGAVSTHFHLLAPRQVVPVAAAAFLLVPVVVVVLGVAVRLKKRASATAAS